MEVSEEERLDRLSKAIAAEEASNLQPAVVVRAFLDPDAPEVFGTRLPQVTLRAWLRLEAASSPFVTGDHVGDAAERVQALCTAFEAITGDPLFPEAIIGTVAPEEVLAAEAAIARRVNECFDTFLPLRLPGAKTVEQPRDAGTGWWVRILARLCNGFHMTLENALDTPLIQAFALLAGHGANDGQEPAGMTWAEREAMRKAGRSSGVVSEPVLSDVAVGPEEAGQRVEAEVNGEDGKNNPHGGSLTEASVAAGERVALGDPVEAGGLRGEILVGDVFVAKGGEGEERKKDSGQEEEADEKIEHGGSLT